MERDAKAAAEELYKIEELAGAPPRKSDTCSSPSAAGARIPGLVAAFESMAEKMHETYNQNVIIQADQRAVDALEMGKQAVVFYIAEEAVTNARKHAKASNIWVRLKLLRGELGLLEIEDDGAGFDVNAVNEATKGGAAWGWSICASAPSWSTASCVLIRPRKGTKVQIVIPFTEEAADRIRHGR